MIRQVQERLYNLNYEIGVLNGQMTEEARKAIREWQKNVEREPTGELARRTGVPTPPCAPTLGQAMDVALSQCRTQAKQPEACASAPRSAPTAVTNTEAG